MKTRTLSQVPRYRLKHTTVVLFITMLCFMQPTAAQNVPTKPKANVRLANEDRKNIQVKTLLAYPKLVSAKPSCEVTSFSISFLPEGGQLYGPFRTEGAAIDEKQVNYLKEHAAENVKIFIEHIHLSCNGNDVTEPSIVVTSFP